MGGGTLWLTPTSRAGEAGAPSGRGRHHGDDPRPRPYDDLGTDENGDPHQRNVTVFRGRTGRPLLCGSGTCSRVAVLAAAGRLGPGRTLVHDSIVGTRFHARIVREVTADGYAAVVPEVTGRAYRTREHRFGLDPADTFGTGFVLR